MTRFTLWLLAMLATPLAQAFDLDQLSARLANPSVVRGPFIQEKHLRALPQPFTSSGHFVLARDHGLLWQLRIPLQQDYRIDAQGIARRVDGQWQLQPAQGVAAQQSRLFLAVLKGDRSGLERDFELNLEGSAERWQLRLTPRSLLLRQVFSEIRIQGGERVERIEMRETQGDSTVLRLPESQSSDQLDATERNDFGT